MSAQPRQSGPSTSMIRKLPVPWQAVQVQSLSGAIKQAPEAGFVAAPGAPACRRRARARPSGFCGRARPPGCPLAEAQAPAIGPARHVGDLARHQATPARPALQHAHRSGELHRIHVKHVLERVDAALTPQVDVRRRQPAETDEHVDRADESPLGQRSLGRADNALLQIPWPLCHVRERFLRNRHGGNGSVASSRRFRPRWKRRSRSS
jgi:hypothetical protein